MKKFLLENKWSILIDLSVVVSFCFFEVTPRNYFILLGLFVFQSIMMRVHQSMNERHRDKLKELDKIQTRHFITIIEEMACEIVYPTKPKGWTTNIMVQVKKVKEDLLSD